MLGQFRLALESVCEDIVTAVHARLRRLRRVMLRRTPGQFGHEKPQRRQPTAIPSIDRFAVVPAYCLIQSNRRREPGSCANRRVENTNG
jgi:hypothetical protein